MDGLAVFMPAETAPQDVVEGVQIPAYLPVQTAGEHPLRLLVEAGHVGKTAAINDKLLFHIPNTFFRLGASVLAPGLEVEYGVDDLHHIRRGADIVQDVLHSLVGHGTLIQSGFAH